MVQMWIISIVSGISFLVIERKTRDLEGIGVFANRRFMVFYFSLMFAATISTTIASSIEIFNDKHRGESKHTNRYVKGEIAARFFMCINQVLFLGVHTMMIIVYHKYGSQKKAHVEQRESITKQMELLCNYDSEVSSYDGEQLERERAKRRHIAYKKMADEQIRYLIGQIWSITYEKTTPLEPDDRERLTGTEASMSESLRKESEEEFQRAFEQGVKSVISKEIRSARACTTESLTSLVLRNWISEDATFESILFPGSHIVCLGATKGLAGKCI